MAKRTFPSTATTPTRMPSPTCKTVEVELDGTGAHAARRLIAQGRGPTPSFRRSCREGVCGF